MGEQKLEDAPKRGRKLAVCGRCMAVGSVLVLGRVAMRVRDRRRAERERREQEQRRHRFPLFGH